MKTVPLAEALLEREFGAKAVNLGAALRAGLPVPEGYALDSEMVDAVSQGAFRGLVSVAWAFQSLGGSLAVRSSAVGEDSAGASFAGQHQTVLNVTHAEEVLNAVRQVRDSAHGDSARAYRRKRGLKGRPKVGVVLQRLVTPNVAGVLFTKNPLNGRDERVIEATWGLGEAVVSGLVTPDVFRLDRAGRVIEFDLGEKHVALHPVPGGGTRTEELDPSRFGEACLSSENLRALNSLASRCEEVFGPDLDIEFALAGGRVYLLQTRPITTLAAQAVA